jgi:hypothetical protein
MKNDIQQNISELYMALAFLKQPEKIRRFFLQICTDSELAELGLRFQAVNLLRKRLSIDEVLNCFPNRADVVAHVLMHKKEQADRVKRQY